MAKLEHSLMRHVKKILIELSVAKDIHKDSEYPWNCDFEKFNIVERVSIVATEAGEALKEAERWQYRTSGKIENIEIELIQTAATCIRVLVSLTGQKAKMQLMKIKNRIIERIENEIRQK